MALAKETRYYEGKYGRTKPHIWFDSSKEGGYYRVTVYRLRIDKTDPVSNWAKANDFADKLNMKRRGII